MAINWDFTKLLEKTGSAGCCTDFLSKCSRLSFCLNPNEDINVQCFTYIQDPGDISCLILAFAAASAARVVAWDAILQGVPEGWAEWPKGL